MSEERAIDVKKHGGSRRRGDSLNKYDLSRAVNEMAARLLSYDSMRLRSSLLKSLAVLGSAVEVDRLRVWKHIDDGEKSRYAETLTWQISVDLPTPSGMPVCESTRAFFPTDREIGESSKEKKYELFNAILRRPSSEELDDDPLPKPLVYMYTYAMARWEPILRSGQSICSAVADLPEIEQEALIPFGVESILVIPIFFKRHFWGFFTFDDCVERRAFPSDVIEILRSGCMVIASVMWRIETLEETRAADERAAIMMDMSPLACFLCDAEFNVLECNAAAVRMFCAKSRDDVCENFFSFSPERQPDGSLSKKKAYELFERMLAAGGGSFKWTHCDAHGNLISTEATLLRVRLGARDIAAVYARDLSEYDRARQDADDMERSVEHAEVLLRSLNEAASILFRSGGSGFWSDIKKRLAALARCADVDRVYVRRNFKRGDANYFACICEWESGRMRPNGGAEDSFTRAAEGGFARAAEDGFAGVSEDGFAARASQPEIGAYADAPGLYETLSRGDCVNGVARFLDAPTQAVLERAGVVSVLVTPIFVRGEFWGYFGLDDCRRERVFTKDEESTFKSGGLLVANAIINSERHS